MDNNILEHVWYDSGTPPSDECVVELKPSHPIMKIFKKFMILSSMSSVLHVDDTERDFDENEAEESKMYIIGAKKIKFMKSVDFTLYKRSFNNKLSHQTHLRGNFVDFKVISKLSPEEFLKVKVNIENLSTTFGI